MPRRRLTRVQARIRLVDRPPTDALNFRVFRAFRGSLLSSAAAIVGNDKSSSPGHPADVIAGLKDDLESLRTTYGDDADVRVMPEEWKQKYRPVEK